LREQKETRTLNLVREKLRRQPARASADRRTPQ
jgi:hypothetical protein